MQDNNNLYPFAAIAGQEDMKLALMLNVINPAIGGVLIRGEKGTAKSTAVRGLISLAEEMPCIEGCRFNCLYGDEVFLCDECRQRASEGETLLPQKKQKKVVELPVSATEDRVVGTLDIEKAIKLGKKEFEPGILAQANNNILYVDEVNLLDDHVVDVLLDSAAMGINTVEREGVSFSHPARFILIGTMNPEEGDLRPQLLDRFGLVVNVMGERDTVTRTEIVKRRLDYERDKKAFAKKYLEQEKELRKKIADAKERLYSVSVPDEVYDKVAEIGIKLEVDGHRADITLIKTAMTIAAYMGEDAVTMQHIEKAACLALPHRMRKHPFQEAALNEEHIRQIING